MVQLPYLRPMSGIGLDQLWKDVGFEPWALGLGSEAAATSTPTAAPETLVQLHPRPRRNRRATKRIQV